MVGWETMQLFYDGTVMWLMGMLLQESLPWAVEELHGGNILIIFQLYSSYDSPDKVLDHFSIISTIRKKVTQASRAKAPKMEFQT